MTFSCQRNTEVYIDGNLTLTGTNQQTKTASVENAAGPCLLAFKTARVNWKIIGSTSTGVVTDYTWKCIGGGSPPSGWQLPGYDDSLWGPAYVVGTNNNATERRIVEEVSSDAMWIWYLNAGNIACRKTLC